MSQQNALGFRSANHLKYSMASQQKVLVLPLYLQLVQTHLECCVQYWAPQNKKGMKVFQFIWRKATKMIEGLGNMSCEEELGTVQSGNEGSRGNLTAICNLLRRGSRGSHWTLLHGNTSQIAWELNKSVREGSDWMLGKFFSMRLGKL